MQEWDIIA